MAGKRSFGVLALMAVSSLSAGAVAAAPFSQGPVVGSTLKRTVVDPTADYDAGVEALDAGRYAEAERLFENVRRAEPRHARTLFRLGQAKEGLGDLEGAASDYQSALKIDPTLFLVTRALAIVDVKRGRLDEARAELDSLKRQSDACATTCAEGPYLTTAITEVEAAMPTGAQAAAGRN
jgi:Flp pilus assembly protein TadD